MSIAEIISCVSIIISNFNIIIMTYPKTLQTRGNTLAELFTSGEENKIQYKITNITRWQTETDKIRFYFYERCRIINFS